MKTIQIINDLNETMPELMDAHRFFNLEESKELWEELGYGESDHWPDLLKVGIIETGRDYFAAMFCWPSEDFKTITTDQTVEIFKTKEEAAEAFLGCFEDHKGEWGGESAQMLVKVRFERIPRGYQIDVLDMYGVWETNDDGEVVAAIGDIFTDKN